MCFMNKKSEVSEKSIGRPKIRSGCEYVRVNLDIPVWMAEKLSSIFLKEGRASRNKLIEWILADYLGYTNNTFEKKCENEAKKKTKKKGP